MRLEFIDLQLFLRIAETASITHGAAQANMALASASARRSSDLRPPARRLVEHLRARVDA